MAIMVVSCVSAIVAQLYPLPFPANRALLAVCVLIYFALSGVLQFMVSFLDRDVTYRSLPSQGPAPGRAILRTALPRGSHIYTCIIEFPAGHEVARFENSVGRYFTTTGELIPERVRKDVGGLCKQGMSAWKSKPSAAQIAGN